MKKTSDFFNDLDLKYPEIAILMEDTNSDIGKFFIPILTPILKKDNIYDKKEVNQNYTKNIINDTNNLYIEDCIISNYVEINIPSSIDKNDLKKGNKFVIIFIGGDINKPYIIGRY